MEPALHRSLGNIEGQLTQLLKSFDDYKQRQQQDHREIEMRVQGLETKINWAAGIFSVITFCAGLLTTYLIKVGMAVT